MYKVNVEREMRKSLFKRVLDMPDLNIKRIDLLEYLKLDFRCYLKEMGKVGYEELVSKRDSAVMFLEQYNGIYNDGFLKSPSKELARKLDTMIRGYEDFCNKINSIEYLWSSVNAVELYLRKIPDISKIDKEKVNSVMKDLEELNKSSFKDITVEIELEGQVLSIGIGKKTTLCFDSIKGTYSSVFNLSLKLLDKKWSTVDEILYTYIEGKYPKLYKVCAECSNCKKSNSLKESIYFVSKDIKDFYNVPDSKKIESDRFIASGLNKEDYHQRLLDFSYITEANRNNSACPCSHIGNNMGRGTAYTLSGLSFDVVFKIAIYAIDKYINRKVIYKEKRKSTKVVTKAHVPSDVYIQNDFIDNDKLDLKFLNLRDYAIYEKRGYEYKGGHHSSPVEHTRRGHWRKYKSGKKVWIDTTEVNKGKGKKAYLVN